jgi:hypothetical protein
MGTHKPLVSSRWIREVEPLLGRVLFRDVEGDSTLVVENR